MGTRMDHYVVLGRRFDMEPFKDKYETLEPFFDNPPEGMKVIYDGMGGKYVVIGQVIAKSNEYEGFDGFIEAPSGIDFTGAMVIHGFIREVLQACELDAQNDDGLKTLVFTHYH
jgi:hypothetical protein